MPSEKIFAYCERGLDPAFWAEPLNALTNAAFVIAGLVALAMAAKGAPGWGRTVDMALCLLVVVIGCGSFAFHTLATRPAAIADVAPIGIFMLSYFALSMCRFLSLRPVWTVSATLGFAIALWLIPGMVRGMAEGLEPSAAQFVGAAAGYLPALIAMAGIGALVPVLGKHGAAPTGKRVLAAALVFTVSLSLRALDRIVCDDLVIAGMKTGTHFFWHLFNALTLFLLLRAAILHWRSQGEDRQSARS